MEYFKSGLKSVLGSQPQAAVPPTGAETVEKLVERVASSTLLEDRRDACRALKSLSKKYRLEVGAQGMDAITQTLQTDGSNAEIIGYALETLCNVTSPEVFEEETVNFENVGQQFTEMLIKKQENIAVILGFLEEFDFRVRWPAVRLLTGLLKSKPKDVQDLILVSPRAVSKLMDLLADSREVIRNDALLLLVELTKANANLQKIVAFENAFDRLFDVLKEEGCLDGGIVVEDCLLLMLNLLRSNTSNINFFKEGSYVSKLEALVKVGEDSWPPQKASNFHCVLKVIRSLVAPNNPKLLTSACQKGLRNSSILEVLCNDVLMANGVPADILTETINTVGEVVRGNLHNQEYLGTVMAPSKPPRTAIVVLLMSMINEKQPFALRCAVLYCFESFLFKNEISQQLLVDTLLPSSNSVALTPGQLLCGGLFNADPLSNWFSAVALSHTLIDNPSQKEQLLRVLLAENVNAQPLSLLHQSAVYLQHTNKLQSKLGVLMLLATWTSNCPAAVAAFVNVPGSMAYLTAQTSATDSNEDLVQGLCAFLMGVCFLFNDSSSPNYTKDNLTQLIEKRVGFEAFAAKLGEVSRSEAYAKAGKQPQLAVKYTAELLLDYEFCKLFKELEGVIVKALGVPNNGMSELSLSEQESGLLLQYKDLIREQDRRLHELNVQLGGALKHVEVLQAELAEARQSNLELRDQNTLLKAQLSAQTNPDNVQEELVKLSESIREKEGELERMAKDQDDLLVLLTDQDVKLNAFKSRLRELGENVEDESNGEDE